MTPVKIRTPEEVSFDEAHPRHFDPHHFNPNWAPADAELLDDEA